MGPTVEESTLIQDLEVDARNIIIDTYLKGVNLYTKEKPIDGLDSLGKKLSDLSEDATRIIQHTLLHLANEVDHGNAAIREARDELDTFHRDYTDALHPHKFPLPFISRFADKIQQRSKNISEAITAYESKLQSTEQPDSPAVLVQVLNEQYNAIIRCSARVSEIQRKSQEIRNLFETKLKEKNANISALKLQTDGREKLSIIESIETAYDQYVEERKRLIEKRDTTTNFSQECAVEVKKTGFGGTSKFGFGGGGFGANKGTTGSTLGATAGSTTPARTNSIKGTT